MSAYDTFVGATSGLKKGESSIDDINDWWAAGHKVFRNDPEAFQQWSQENPQMAIRWHARAANKNVNTDWDNKKHHQMAQAIALGEGQRLGMGNDMKKDGKMLAFDYNTFKDVNNEWGEGDFWKIGTPQTLDKGFGNFIDNLDLKDVAMMAAPFVLGPMVAPALAAAGVPAGSALSGAFTSAITQSLKGGDINDIIKAGALGGTNAWLGDVLDSALVDTDLGNIFADRGWDPSAISDALRKGGMEALEGGDMRDVLLGSLEKYVDSGGGLGTIPLPDMGDGLGLELPDWLPDGDLLGEIGDKWGEFKDSLPEFKLPNFKLPGVDWKGPEFGGGGWGDAFASIGNVAQGLFGDRQPQQGLQQGMMAQKPYEPTELAELNPMFQLQPPRQHEPLIQPTGMFS